MVVPFLEKHLDAIAKIESITFSVPWTRQMLAESLSLEVSHFLVWEKDGVALGYVGSYFSKYECSVTNVAVHPDFRSKGIGYELMRALIDEGRKRKIENITLEVRESNVRARLFYERLGFEAVGIRRGFYTAPREDAVIMNYIYK